MAQTVPKNLRDVISSVPDCCGKCKHNNWNEFGCHCHNPANIEFEEGESIDTYVLDEDHGEVDWSLVCDNFEKGIPTS